MGEGGVGVFVGGGGVSRCDESVDEQSEVSSEGRCPLDVVSEDSDEGDREVNGLLSRRLVISGVIVSARGRETKRPCTRGCFFQASVDRCRVYKSERARCRHDAVLTRKKKHEAQGLIRLTRGTRHKTQNAKRKTLDWKARRVKARIRSYHQVERWDRV